MTLHYLLSSKSLLGIVLAIKGKGFQELTRLPKRLWVRQKRFEIDKPAVKLDIQQSANESRYCYYCRRKPQQNKNTKRKDIILLNTPLYFKIPSPPIYQPFYMHQICPSIYSSMHIHPAPLEPLSTSLPHPSPPGPSPTTLPSIRHIRQPINLRRQIRNPKRLGNGIVHPSIHSHTRLFGSRIGRNTENRHMSFQ